MVLSSYINGKNDIYFAISDRFVFVRTTTGTKEVTGYSIWGANLVEYLPTVADANTYTRNWVMNQL